MKIIAFNLWNCDIDFPQRLELLTDIFQAEQADVLALQEVRDDTVVKKLAKACGYPHFFWEQFRDCQEGLAILSRYPLTDGHANLTEEDIHNCATMTVQLDYLGISLAVINVHLDYASTLNRETEIVKLMEQVEKGVRAQYHILLGDFNSSAESSVYRYLTGEQSLKNHSTKWIDLALSYAWHNQSQAQVTLDFVNNPRWDQEQSLDIPKRCDWIMLKDPYPQPSPTLDCLKLLGTERKNGLTPSDHYGIMCNLSFPTQD